MWSSPRKPKSTSAQSILSKWIKNKCERRGEVIHSFLLSTYCFKDSVLDSIGTYSCLPDFISQSCDKATPDFKWGWKRLLNRVNRRTRNIIWWHIGYSCQSLCFYPINKIFPFKHIPHTPFPLPWWCGWFFKS